MRVAAYVRVSTTNQVHAQTIDQQLARVQEYIRSQGWLLSDEGIFRDDGFSGAVLDRPGLDSLRDRVRAREFDRVVVTAPDRLARNYVHQMVLIDELARSGCKVEFTERPMSEDPHDQLLLQIRGAVAEYERTLITERMRRGRQAKIRAGVMLPWTKRPYGFQLHPDRPRDPSGVQVEPAEAAIVAEIFVAYARDGASLLSVTDRLYELGIPSPLGRPRWTPASLRGILTNPIYIGKVYSGRWHYRPPQIRRSATRPMGRPHASSDVTPPETWTLVATIPAIVSEELFELVQRKLAQNQTFARRNNTTHQYLLRALVSCGKCGYASVGRRNGRYGYYVCSSKHRGRGAEHCSSRHIPAQQLDDLVWQDVCDVLMHPDSLEHALQRAHGGHWLPQELQARRENLRQARTALRQQIGRLTEAYLHEVIPLAEYERRRHELEDKDQSIAKQETQLDREATNQIALATPCAGLEDFCQRIQAGLDNATFEQRRRLVELLIDRVIVNDEEVEIHYVIPTTPASEVVRFCHLRIAYFNNSCRMTHIGNPETDDVRHYNFPARPVERYGVHDRMALIPGELASFGERWEGDECVLEAVGRVTQAQAYGENLVLTRRYTARLGEARFFMHDEVENAGYLPASHMLLYHINTGFPFVDEGSELVAPFGGPPAVLFGDADPQQPESYSRFIAPQRNWVQQTFEHSLQAEADGHVPVAIVNPKLGRGGQALYVIYDQQQMPNYIEWRMMGEGQYAVGIEPCTNGFGRERLRQAGELIMLHPGERRVYDIEVGVLDGADEIEAFRKRVRSL
jgi:site-specific DNA recombinase